MKKVVIGKIGLGIALLLLTALPSYSQLKKAHDYYNSHQYFSAIPYYLKALKKEEDSLAIKNLADCYYLAHEYKRAEVYYKRAVELYPNESDIRLRYGQILKTNRKLEEAKEVFIVYAQKTPEDKNGNKYTLGIDKVKSWTARTPTFSIENLTEINTKNSEFSPVYYQNNLIFVTDRFYDHIDETESSEGAGYLTITQATLKADSTYGKVKPFPHFNNNYHNGPICFNKLQNEAYFTRVDYDEKKGKDFVNKPQIYSATKTGKKWSKPTSFKYNDPAYSFSHPSLSPDGKTLYFTSTMPGGEGKMDIYTCQKEGGVWGEPVNLGKRINTSENEMFPYAYRNDKLYFSSNGQVSIGGLDILSAKKVNGVWTDVSNLKSPINSSFDDFGMFFTDSVNGFFTSNREEGKGGDDIYSILQTVDPRETMELTGMFMYSELTPAAKQEIKLMDTDGNIIMVTQTDEFGHFSFKDLKPDDNYLFVVDERHPDFTALSSIYLTNEEGKKVITLGQPIAGHFKFRMLEKEVIETLLPIDVLDIKLTFLDIFGQLYGALPGDYHEKIEVFLLTEDGEIIYSTFTDENGKFIFENLLSNENYKLKTSSDTNDLEMVFINKKGEKIADAIKTDAKEYLIKDHLGSRMQLFAGRVFTILPGDYKKTLEVFLINDEGKVIYTTTTDSTGYFEIKAIDTTFHYAIKLAETDSLLKIALLNKSGESNKIIKLTENGDYPLYTQLERLALFGSIYKILPGDYSDKIEVYLVDDNGNIVYTTITDENGNFLFENLPPDHGLTIQLKEDQEDVNIAILDKNNPRSKLFGNLYQTLPGDVVEGMEVYLVDDDGKIIYTAITDKFGNFVFENLPPDHSYQLKTQNANDDLNMIILNELGEKEKATQENGIFSLAEIARKNLYGNLFQTLPGDYQAGMEVYLVDDDGKIVYTAITDAKGNFLFKNLPADHNYTLKAKNSEDYNMILLNEFGEMIASTEQDENGEFIPAEKQTNLFGRVFETLSGDYQAGMEIHLVDDDGNIVYTTTIDRYGKFNFQNLPPDVHYTLKMEATDSEMKLVMLDENGNTIGEVQKSASGAFDYNYLVGEEEYISLRTESDVIIKIVDDQDYIIFTIAYDYDRSNIKNSARTELDKLTTLMQKNPHIAVKIRAYADSKGTDEYNNKLTVKRATSAKYYLINNGISSHRIDAKGMGERNPIAPNFNPDGSDNEGGRTKNRRAEVSITKLKLKVENKKH